MAETGGFDGRQKRASHGLRIACVRRTGSTTAVSSRSRSFIFAATANRIWQILLQGKDLPTAIEGWRKTYEQMRPHIGPILEWLRVIAGG